ncbi:MAG: RNA-directed DNA polymerase [Xanthobacteraceae bacterium]|uniref:RNA-directed DNA polymerase n=1 Tax=Pseudolabrys sp. TaxID=1960880 RepID=UPI003D12025D
MRFYQIGGIAVGGSKTKKDRHKQFLKSGYFPDELPPPFNSRDIAKFRDYVLNSYNKIPNPKNGDPWFYSYRSNPAVIYFPRFGKQDRKHHILNPVSFFHLSNEIANNWVEIKKKLRESKYSASTLVFNWGDGQSLLKLDFGERDRRLSSISVNNTFVLISDIARYYHSIYTHALSWAVHGKQFAKKNRSYKHLGNRLDLLSRNSQDGQTIGIPVGPDTSRYSQNLLEWRLISK